MRDWKGTLFFHSLLHSGNHCICVLILLESLISMSLPQQFSVNGLTGLESERNCLPKQWNHCLLATGFMSFLYNRVCFQGSFGRDGASPPLPIVYFSALYESRSFSLYWEQTAHWKNLTVLTNLLLPVHELYRPLELDVMLTIGSDFHCSLWAVGSMIFGSHVSPVSTQQNGCDKMIWKNSSALSRPAWLLHNRN